MQRTPTAAGGLTPPIQAPKLLPENNSGTAGQTSESRTPRTDQPTFKIYFTLTKINNQLVHGSRLRQLPASSSDSGMGRSTHPGFKPR